MRLTRFQTHRLFARARMKPYLDLMRHVYEPVSYTHLTLPTTPYV